MGTLSNPSGAARNPSGEVGAASEPAFATAVGEGARIAYLERVAAGSSDPGADMPHRFNFTQDQSITNEGTLGHLMDIMATNSAESNARVAADILTPKRLTYGMPTVPDEVVNVLEGEFPKTARYFGYEALITSGLAAAMYGSPRQASLDIDFGLLLTPNAAMQIQDSLTQTTGQQVLVHHFTHPISPCLGARAKVNSTLEGQALVDLDGLVITRFKPFPEGFVYEFPVDAHDFLMRRTAVLPNGEEVSLVPPEHVLFYKLLACRGVDQGKYDLPDAGGIIAANPLDPTMLYKLISNQAFRVSLGNEEIDGEAIYQKFGHALGDQKTFGAFLDAAGCREPQVTAAVIEWFERFRSDPSRAVDVPPADMSAALTVVKQAAMTSRLLEALDRVYEFRTTPVPARDEAVRLIDLYDEKFFTEKVESLRKFFLFYGTNELGK